MNFHPVAARPGWREQVQELGFQVSLLDDPPYWVEAIDQPFCASFRLDQVQAIATAAAKLSDLALELVEEVCNGARSEAYFDLLKIAPHFRNCIRESWQRHDASLYGRFDLAYHTGSLKLLELNFDTPTSLYESSLLQRLWFEDTRHLGIIPDHASQCNSIEERLTEALRSFIGEDEILHLGTFRHATEEIENIRFIQTCATRAGVEEQFIPFETLRRDAEGRLFDRQGRMITRLFKLFPWELLIEEDRRIFQGTGKYLFAPLVEFEHTTMIEPAWKAILSNKAALPLLWQLCPENPYLLEASLDDQSQGAQKLRDRAHIRKPIFGREGAGISIKVPGQPEEIAEGAKLYGEEGHILQLLSDLPKYNDRFVVLGAWLIEGEFAGISLRADHGKITGRSALFVPHYVN